MWNPVLIGFVRFGFVRSPCAPYAGTVQREKGLLPCRRRNREVTWDLLKDYPHVTDSSCQGSCCYPCDLHILQDLHPEHPGAFLKGFQPGILIQP